MPKRLLSLDVLRGLTIAGMIIVNDPGSWSSVYAPLLHAEWHGITPTDFVFPFFLFMVGVSIVLAYTRRIQENAPKGQMVRKIFTRSLIIYALGMFLWIFPGFDFSIDAIRFTGVLHRIAVVFLACALLFLYSDWKRQAWAGGILLVGYWLAMTLIPVPVDEVIRQALATGEVTRSGGPVPVSGLIPLGDRFIAANLEQGTNLQAWIDRLLLPGRMWEVTWDPEGILSTLPAIATGISGMLAGRLILMEMPVERKMTWLFTAGFLTFTLGNFWGFFFEINKNLWTSSYVLYTSGLAMMTLAAIYWLVDVQGYTRWTLPFVVFGTNAIVAYVLAGVLISLLFIPESTGGFNAVFMNGLTGLGLSARFASMLWAFLYTTLIFGLVYILYRRKIFVRI
ncbi:MAG: DUF5009 domain-containing protein [Bacteroidia bacterium]|nr:DUF5009 domain-containing protein [Bacteroidia bacterium]